VEVPVEEDVAKRDTKKFRYNCANKGTSTVASVVFLWPPHSFCSQDLILKECISRSSYQLLEGEWIKSDYGNPEL
jgi:hypothetical protein